MTSPVFVETSAGLINLSLVTRIVDVGEDIRLIFVGPPAKDEAGNELYWIYLPAKEWHSIRAQMAEARILLVE